MFRYPEWNPLCIFKIALDFANRTFPVGKVGHAPASRVRLVQCASCGRKNIGNRGAIGHSANAEPSGIHNNAYCDQSENARDKLPRASERDTPYRAPAEQTQKSVGTDKTNAGYKRGKIRKTTKERKKVEYEYINDDTFVC